MPFSSQLDCLSWSSLDFPYNVINRELSSEPRLVQGSQNSAVTLGGKLTKRAGTVGIPGTDALPSGARIDRLWVYQTLDSPTPKVYLVASVAIPHTPTALPLLFTSPLTTWKLYYCDLSGGIYWSLAPSLRGCNESLRAHEASVSRGLLFVKSYPSETIDLLGSVILDGTGGTMSTRPWGALGPTLPAAIVGTQSKLTATLTSAALVVSLDTTSLPAAPFNLQIDYETVTVTVKNVGNCVILRGAQGTIAAAHPSGTTAYYLPWSASSHPVVVNLGWTYSSAFESITGNVTNRVDIQRNPDTLPSFTGPFLNLIPTITLQGHTDTINFPYIRVFRTTDGGGTFFQLERIPNPGTATFTYYDDSLESDSGFGDPLPDAQLDANIIAPTLVSNSPPPSVTTPLVTGEDKVAISSPIAYFQGRFWYAIGNVVFYSGEEEITLGVPEECWPSGTLGNFFRYQHPVLNLQATSNALYIMTNEDTHAITGNNRLTFNSNPIFQTIGAPFNQPRAITRYGESVAWLANDYRIVYAQNSTLFSISDELGTDLSDAIGAGGEVDLEYWANLDKEYIVVNVSNADNAALARQWIFDIKKSSGGQEGGRQNFWYAPWNVPASAMVSGRVDESANQRSLIFSNVDVENDVTFLATYDTTGVAAVDSNPDGTTLQRYNCVMISALFGLPAGNHINALRKPSETPTISFIQLDRTAYTHDTDPEMFWYQDDAWTDPLPLPPGELPDFRKQSKGYITYKYPITSVAQHLAFKIQKLNSPDRFEIQDIFIAFDPTKG